MDCDYGETQSFLHALETGDLEEIRKVPKADLHNHFVLGGEREYLYKKTGTWIHPLCRPVSSFSAMDEWSRRYLSGFDSPEGRALLVEAAFVQAHQDGIKILEIGEDIWGLAEYFGNKPEKLMGSFVSSRNRFAPDTQLRLQIGLSRHCAVKDLQRWLEPFWGRREFYSIDLYGDELAQPIEQFVPIYRRAKSEGLVLKAHLGEYGTAEDVQKGVELLELDEVQHGIAAVTQEKTLRFLADHHIRLNVAPTSNWILGRVPSLKEHPIAQLLRSGVEVTINSDDVLIFDSDVSKEYLRLYQSGVLTAEELDQIRRTGLSPAKSNRVL